MLAIGAGSSELRRRAAAAAAGVNDGWAPAPEFDDDHPEELSYRPFPIAPFLTQSASADDAALVKLVHPDIARTLDLLDDARSCCRCGCGPGEQMAEVMWAQQFRGRAVDHLGSGRSAAAWRRAHLLRALASRAVKTTTR